MKIKLALTEYEVDHLSPLKHGNERKRQLERVGVRKKKPPRRLAEVVWSTSEEVVVAFGLAIRSLRVAILGPERGICKTRVRKRLRRGEGQ